MHICILHCYIAINIASSGIESGSSVEWLKLTQTGLTSPPRGVAPPNSGKRRFAVRAVGFRGGGGGRQASAQGGVGGSSSTIASTVTCMLYAGNCASVIILAIMSDMRRRGYYY